MEASVTYTCENDVCHGLEKLCLEEDDLCFLRKIDKLLLQKEEHEVLDQTKLFDTEYLTNVVHELELRTIDICARMDELNRRQMTMKKEVGHELDDRDLFDPMLLTV